MEVDLELEREAAVSCSLAPCEESSDALVRKNSMRFRKKSDSTVQETEMDGKAADQGTTTGDPKIVIDESEESSRGSTMAIESALNAKLELGVYYDKVQGAWKCHHCSWVCSVLKPGVELIDNHKEHCQRMNNTRASVRQGFPLEHEIQECSRANLYLVQGGGEIENGNTVLLEDKTNGGQGAPENVGLQQHQHGKNFSESVLQNSQNEFMRKQDETQLRNHWTQTPEESTSTGNAEEEVVRVVKEQQSHDLLCPVCGSCITKRVILRKRKRTSPIFVEDEDQENLDVLIPAPAEGLGEISKSQTVQLETLNEETKTYRCFSCLSLFIPTGLLYFSRKPEIQNRSSTTQSSSEMRRDPENIVDEKERIDCLFFLYPRGTTKERKPGAEPVSSARIPQTDGEDEVSASNVVNGDDLDATIIPPGTVLTGPAVGEASVTSGSHSDVGAADDQKSSEGSTGVIQEVGNITMANGGANNHADTPSKHDDEKLCKPLLNKDTSNDESLEKEPSRVANIVNDLGMLQLAKDHAGSDEKLHKPLQDKDTSTPLLDKDTDVHGNEKKHSDRVESISTSKEQNRPLPVHAEGEYLVPHVTSIFPHGESTVVDIKPGEDPAAHVTDAVAVERPTDGRAYWDKLKRIYGHLNLSFTGSGVVSSAQSKEEKTYEKLHKPLLDEDTSKPLLDKDTSNDESLDEEPSTVANIDAHRNEENVSGHVEPISTSEEQDQPLLERTEVPAASVVDHVTPEQRIDGRTQWDILKSIVYGGLNVSITSLGVVSSAAGGEAKTLTVIAIGLANMFAGLFMLFNSISELQNQQFGDTTQQFRDIIGHSFWFNGSVAVFSYFIFGSLAPITYGFSFQKSDDRNYKFFTTSAVCLVSIILLAIGKARVTPQVTTRLYFTTVSRYVIIGFWASIIGYLSGEYIKKLLEKWGIKTDNGNTQKLLYY